MSLGCKVILPEFVMGIKKSMTFPRTEITFTSLPMSPRQDPDSHFFPGRRSLDSPCKGTGGVYQIFRKELHRGQMKGLECVIIRGKSVM